MKAAPAYYLQTSVVEKIKEQMPEEIRMEKIK